MQRLSSTARLLPLCEQSKSTRTMVLLPRLSTRRLWRMAAVAARSSCLFYEPNFQRASSAHGAIVQLQQEPPGAPSHGVSGLLVGTITHYERSTSTTQSLCHASSRARRSHCCCSCCRKQEAGSGDGHDYSCCDCNQQHQTNRCH